MNFFGMGSMEIVVILVVALMIFGPGKLPEVAGQAGKMLRDFKKVTTDLSDEFEKTSGIGDIKKQVQKEMAGIQKEVGGVTSGVKKDLTSASNTVNSVTGAKKPATATRSTQTKPAGAVAKTTTSNSGTLKTTTNVAGTKTTSAAKPSGTSAAKSTATKTVAPIKVEPPKASKSDPFADVSFMDDVVEDAKPAPAAAKAPSTPATVGSSVDTSDALARARARRQQAGYSRVQA